jgi:hypothetical protein
LDSITRRAGDPEVGALVLPTNIMRVETRTSSQLDRNTTAIRTVDVGNVTVVGQVALQNDKVACFQARTRNVSARVGVGGPDDSTCHSRKRQSRWPSWSRE